MMKFDLFGFRVSVTRQSPFLWVKENGWAVDAGNVRFEGMRLERRLRRRWDVKATRTRPSKRHLMGQEALVISGGNQPLRVVVNGRLICGGTPTEKRLFHLLRARA